MDSNKIGNLIKVLRKKHDLTQQELAEKVGVGFRAVSKWECGINIPDLANINELCKIFDITKDELLSGELKEKEKFENNLEDRPKKKTSSRIVITISIITVILLAIISIFINQNNKTYTYKLSSAEQEDYYVDGKAYYDKNKITVIINQIDFKDVEFENIIIKNYEYELSINDKFLFGYGIITETSFLEEPLSIQEFTETLNINFESSQKISQEEIIKNDMLLKFQFLTELNEVIDKELKITINNIE